MNVNKLIPIIQLRCKGFHSEISFSEINEYIFVIEHVINQKVSRVPPHWRIKSKLVISLQLKILLSHVKKLFPPNRRSINALNHVADAIKNAT